MPPIKQIAILGAGALGAYYASRFQAAPGFSVRLVADAEHAKRLRRSGVMVNGQQLQLPVVGGEVDQPPADLVIVALKHHQLEAALPLLQPLVSSQTIILSVMNGLDSEERIAEVFSAAKVLYCIAVGIDAVREDSGIEVAHAGRLVFGEATNIEPPAAEVLRVQEALTRAGLPWETPPDMLRMLWWKFMINVGVNQASAVLRAPYRVFQNSAEARAVVAVLMEEVMLLAGREGIDLGPADLEEWWRVLGRLAPEGKTSMLQDVEAGRRTEVEMFAGKVVELGKQHVVPTPANELMLHLLKVLDGSA